MKTRIVRSLILLFVALTFSTQLAAAVIEEMIVTSNKRGAFDAQDLAQAVYGFDGDAMDRKRQINFDEFAPVVPGLSFQDLGPGDKEYIIRGINGNGPSVVGVYFDEYVISANDQQDGGGKNAPIKMVDLERVEVLNGPQGTLYGANSMAGNIRFIPRKASTEGFDSYVNADLSNTEGGGFNYLLDGAVNIPMGDKFAARIVGWREDNDGWIDQPRLQTGETTFGFAEDINDVETNGGRILLTWKPTDSLSFDGLYMIQRMEVGGSSRFSANGIPVWTQISQPIQDLIDTTVAADPTAENVSYAPIPGLANFTPTGDFQNTDITVNTRDDDVDLFGLTGNLGFDWGTFTVLGSYYKHDILYKFDSTPILSSFGVGTPGVTVQPQTYETTTAEARFASSFDSFFNFVGGVYYQKDENDFDVNVTTTDNRGNSVPWDELNSNDFFVGTNGINSAFFGRFRNDEIEQLGVFGEATIDFLNRWQLAVGARWIDVEVTSTQATSHAFVGQLSDGLPGDLVGTTPNGNEIRRLQQDDDTVIPKVSLSFRVSDEVLIYGLYSEGFRVGGVNNANQPFAPGIPTTFASDELQNIEFGVKSQWFDQRMQVNAAVFLIDWNDIQVEPRDPRSNIPFTTNGGEAEVNGIEWSITGIPVDNIELMFTGTYFLDAQLTTDQPPLTDASPYVITGLSGDSMPNVPEFQLYWAGTWEGNIGSRPLLLTLDATYRDSTNTEFRTDNPFNIKLDSFVVANAFANYHVTDSVSIGLYVKNLTDELALYDGIGTFENPQAVVANRPRTWGATISWRLK